MSMGDNKDLSLKDPGDADGNRRGQQDLRVKGTFRILVCPSLPK